MEEIQWSSQYLNFTTRGTSEAMTIKDYRFDYDTLGILLSILRRMDSIKIGALNCQGLEGKFETPEFIDMVSSCLIFGVSESWLKKGEKSIHVNDFKFYPCSRGEELGVIKGGVGLFVREDFKKWIKILYNILYLMNIVFGVSLRKIFSISRRICTWA